METAIAEEDGKLGSFKSTMTDLEGKVRDAEATLAAQKEVTHTEGERRFSLFCHARDNAQ